MTARWTRVWLVAIAAGVIATVPGLWQDPQRAWAGVLLAGYGLAGVGLGGLLFIAMQYAAGARWGVAFRRVPEAMVAALPFGAAAIAAVLVLYPSLYAWTADAAHLAGFKGWWLSLPFFRGRAAIYIGTWLLFGFLIVRTSHAQDGDGAARWTRANVRWSLAFIAVFALTFWLASFDWIMSLDPHWYSTIFGIYNFAGLFLAALAVIILLALALRRSGALGGALTDEHLHDLGKLLFAFSTFWMYIWFSQYMLIWYANIPEEAEYYVLRREGSWLGLFYANVLLNWVLPFVALLSRPAKRRAALLASICAVVLAGRWVDLYLMIAPSTGAVTPRVGLPELAPTVVAIAVFLLAFDRAFRGAPVVPARDPALHVSLSYHS
jgi:hypothetical protein